MKVENVHIVASVYICCWVLQVYNLQDTSFDEILFLFLDIGLIDGQEVVVADSTTPKPIICRIHLSSVME